MASQNSQKTPNILMVRNLHYFNVMKAGILVCLLSALFAPLFAKSDTVAVTFPGENLDIALAAGPVIKVTRLNRKSGVLVGLQAGAVFNRSVHAYLEGCFLANGLQVRTDSLRDLHLAYLSMGMNYIFIPQKTVHFSLGASFGAGDIGYRNPNKYYFFWRYYRLPSDGVVFLEPEANAIFNLNAYLKVNAGIGYRILGGVVLRGLSNAKLSGPTLSLRLQFGMF